MIPDPSIDPRPTAAMIAIGDELLSGRTKDANIHHLAKWLEGRGINLVEVRIVPDIQGRIVDAVNALRTQVDTVFTSGGIGPTHDDITADAMGVAFGVMVEENPEAFAILEQWYADKGEVVTDARRRMARTPQGARLIHNSVSGAPGFVMQNVYVLAGVPAIFNAMLDTLDGEMKKGPAYTVYTVEGVAAESTLVEGLIALETALKGLKLGSYPGKSGVSGNLAIVCKSFDQDLARRAATAVEGLFRAQGVEPTTHPGFGQDLQ